ncbi:MAG: hypothetical protein HFH68_03945 [Lachnospiraceae bacterium]|nr:hypothetical protein [Lachnospiraceae bacterium]
MVKKVFSIIITLALILCALPDNIMAAENKDVMTPTCVLSRALKLGSEEAENEAEGWKWTPDPEGGGTLELENCYIQSETAGVLEISNYGTKKDINIILRGTNILETTNQELNSIVIGNGKENYIISEDGQGSLEIRTKEPITSAPYNAPYAFGGENITIKSGTIVSSVLFCMITKGVYIEGGFLDIEIPEGVNDPGGIYTIDGPVEISGGKLNINSHVGIFIPGNTQNDASAGGQMVNISGGEVNIKSDFVGIYILENYLDNPNQAVNISGGKVDCEAGAVGFYSKNFNVYKGEGPDPQVNVSVKQDSKLPAIYPRSNNVNISGGIVMASGGATGIAGLDSQDSEIKDCLVVSDGKGEVYGTVKAEEDLALPENTVLNIPEGAVLTIPEGVTLKVPDSSSVQVPEGSSLVNNGILVLPEGSSVSCTGTGFIQKGGDLYTNGNERLYSVTIRQKGGEVIEHYKENDVVTFSPEADTEELRFKEWKVVSGTAVIENNYFTMPAGDVIIEAVFEHFYKLAVKQPGGIVTGYYKQDSDIELVPEDIGKNKMFKEWKVVPDGIVHIIDNKFKMPACAVTAEAVYEQLYKVTISQNGNITEKYYSEGSNVQLVKEPAPEGMEFEKWEVTPGTFGITGDSFTMPGFDVSVEAVYKKILSGTTPPDSPVTPPPASTQKPGLVVLPPYAVPSGNVYKINVKASPAEGGTVTGNTEAKEGSSVTVEAFSSSGYVFTGWTENGKTVSTDAKHTFKAERNRELVAVFKKSQPGGTGGILKKINVANDIKTVSQVSLPDGWEWKEEDREKEIPAGGSVTVTANYTAKDAGDYAGTSLNIIITRDKCVAGLTVFYTGAGEYAPGCVSDGIGHTECSLCGSILNTNIKVPATGHTEGQPVVIKASKGKNGSIVTSCINCNKILSERVINAIKTIKLSNSKGTYNKKKHIPGITVKDSSGKQLASGTDYTVSWAKGMKKPGIYTVKITFMGMYSGTAEKTYKIIPKGTKIKKITSKRNGFTVAWKRPASYVTGCQIQYSTNKKFKKKNIKKVTIKNRKTISKDIKGRKTGRKYYVRIRTYKNIKVNGKKVKVFSKWSAVKTARIKK